MAKDSIYDEVGGCPGCPYVEECVVLSDCAGYTMNDEHGVCPEELVVRHMIAREKMIHEQRRVACRYRGKGWMCNSEDAPRPGHIRCMFRQFPYDKVCGSYAPVVAVPIADRRMIVMKTKAQIADELKAIVEQSKALRDDNPTAYEKLGQRAVALLWITGQTLNGKTIDKLTFDKEALQLMECMF